MDALAISGMLQVKARGREICKGFGDRDIRTLFPNTASIVQKKLRMENDKIVEMKKVACDEAGKIIGSVEQFSNSKTVTFYDNEKGGSLEVHYNEKGIRTQEELSGSYVKNGIKKVDYQEDGIGIEKFYSGDKCTTMREDGKTPLSSLRTTYEGLLVEEEKFNEQGTRIYQKQLVLDPYAIGGRHTYTIIRWNDKGEVTKKDYSTTIY